MRENWVYNDSISPQQPEGFFMVRIASLFSQLLEQLPRNEFAALVKKHGAEYSAKH